MFNLAVAQDAATDPVADAVSSFSVSELASPQFWIDFVVNYGWRIGVAILILWIGSMIAGKIKGFIKRRVEKNDRIDDTLGNFIHSMIGYALTIIVWLAAISVLGVQLASVFVILSSLVLAVGLALQGSMSKSSSVVRKARLKISIFSRQRLKHSTIFRSSYRTAPCGAERSATLILWANAGWMSISGSIMMMISTRRST